jgi:hypothetical protein
MRECRGTEDLGAPADQFCWPFVDGMVRRMATSYHKYGHMASAAEHGIDLVACLEQRLELYKETRNTEHLIDAANFAMIEFAGPSLEGAYYAPTDSDESPGIAVKPKRNVMGGVTRQANWHGKHAELDR